MLTPLIPTNQDEWLTGLRAGNETVFRQIYEHFWSPLYSVSYNFIRDRITAEEMVQEVFVTLWLKREQLLIHTSLRAYLIKAIRHQVYDYIDKQAVRQRVHQQIRNQESEAIYSTDEAIDYSELQTRLTEAVDQLPQPTQTIFRMSRFDYLSTQEIARQLNLSSKAIEYHLTRALRLLRLQLKDFVLILLVASELMP